MKLSEIKGEEAMEVLADILESATVIMQDEEIVRGFRKGGERIKIISTMLRKYKKEIIQILAAMERKPVDEFECNVMTLPAKLIEIFNDAELMGFFFSPAETDLSNGSGSATENTGDGESDS